VSQLNKNILYALAQEMKTTKINYVLTGWADDYTGSNKVNEKLKIERVKSVKSILVKYGVDESRLIVAMGDGSLAKAGEKGASLDRAVTIVVER
jgi:outer membrane protein OmpA-like peptidoglycan-associated protein